MAVDDGLVAAGGPPKAATDPPQKESDNDAIAAKKGKEKRHGARQPPGTMRCRGLCEASEGRLLFPSMTRLTSLCWTIRMRNC